MISKAQFKGFLAILSGMWLFKSTTHMGVVEGIFMNYPYYMAAGALILFFYRDQIADKLGFK